MGVPDQMITGKGTQFTSNMMQEVNRLIGVRGGTTTPYHPQTNGLLERFNGTLKSVLKKVCQEKPRTWDRFIPAILFAYREYGTPGEYRILPVRTLLWKNCAGSHEDTEKTVDGRQGQRGSENGFTVRVGSAQPGGGDVQDCPRESETRIGQAESALRQES